MPFRLVGKVNGSLVIGDRAHRASLAHEFTKRNRFPEVAGDRYGWPKLQASALWARLRASVNSEVVWLRRSASTRMISTAISGKSANSLRKSSFRIRNASSEVVVLTVAVRGVLQRMAISPTIEFCSTSATFSCPLGRRNEHIRIARKDHIAASPISP